MPDTQAVRVAARCTEGWTFLVEVGPRRGRLDSHIEALAKRRRANEDLAISHGAPPPILAGANGWR